MGVSHRIGTGAGDGFWVTKNKRVLKIESMTNTHLANALSLMRREEPGNPKIREVLAEMLRRSAQMAGDAPVKW